MKTTELSKVFESANNVMNQTAESRKIWRTTYCSLSRILRDTQTKSALKVTASVFESLGLPANGRIKPAEINAIVKRWYTNKKGIECPEYISRHIKTDKDGNKCKNEDGTYVYEFGWKHINPGTWTFDKLVKLVATYKN